MKQPEKNLHAFTSEENPFLYFPELPPTYFSIKGFFSDFFWKEPMLAFPFSSLESAGALSGLKSIKLSAIDMAKAKSLGLGLYTSARG